MSLDVTYTAEQVAQSLRCSAWFVRQQVAKGIVSPMRLGSRPNAPLRFTDADVQALREALMPPPRPARKRKRRAV